MANNGLGDDDDDGDTLIDEFVTANGPIRNFDITQVNGPDMRFATLEDIYGDAGNSFQGALGFWVQEGITGTQPSPGYGVGIDDMVVEWREYSLAKDSTSCASGVCATLTVAVTNMFEGSGVVTVTVLDASPWDAVNVKNDCNGDGDFADAADDQDCDNNGTLDVTIKAFSDGEPLGEIIALNRTTVGGSQWTGEVPFSSRHRRPRRALPVRSGVDPRRSTSATRTERRHRQRCKNDADPSRWGFLDTNTTVSVDAARVIVKATRISNAVGNGDSDGFADRTRRCRCSSPCTTAAARPGPGSSPALSTNDPNVDCVSTRCSSSALSRPRRRGSGDGGSFVFRVDSSVLADRSRRGADRDLQRHRLGRRLRHLQPAPAGRRSIST